MIIGRNNQYIIRYNLLLHIANYMFYIIIINYILSYNLYIILTYLLCINMMVNKYINIHYIIYLIYILVCMKSLQSYPTLCDPMDCSPPGSSVHGIPQARILE